MKKPFTTISKADVEMLRRKPMSVSYAGSSVAYGFTKAELDNAVKHLETLYSGTVRRSFAAKILLLNEIH